MIAHQLDHLVRPNILALKPYSSARHEFKGVANIQLDANENPYETGRNRYPDPFHAAIRERLSLLKNVPVESIFLGNGSDEVIDLLIRIFCIPGIDHIITPRPTYGMYKVSAATSDVAVKEILSFPDFQLNVPELLAAVTPQSKLLFLCHPNNPSGNALREGDVLRLLRDFPGIVVIDEAYIDFCTSKSFLPRLVDFPRLVIMQTFSKAWGLAGLRLGMAFASSYIIDLLYKVKPPYNVNVLTQMEAVRALEDAPRKEQWVANILAQRQRLQEELSELTMVKTILPSDANFLLVRFDEPKDWFEYLKTKGIVIRSMTHAAHCSDCLRITVGTALENEELIQALKNRM